MPSRRTVLTAAALGTAAVATGVGLYVSGPGALLLPDPVDTVLDPSLSAAIRLDALAQHLRARFSYLVLPDATLQAFSDAVMAHGSLPRTSGALASLRRDFLMCTDFFLHDADESKPLAFVAWYDPYVTPCWNPLARPA